MIVSIIIPTLNRSTQLLKTLESFQQFKEISSLFEILVVDNGSTDNTASIVKQFIVNNNSLNTFYLYNDFPGLLTGRHYGAEHAKGDIFAFIDDDIILSKTWLFTLVELNKKYTDYSLFTGPSLPLYECIPPHWLSHFWNRNPNGDETCTWLSLMNLGDIAKPISPFFVWGLNFIIRKSVFIELGGFNPDNIPDKYQKFQGDGETGLSFKAIQFGHKALYLPELLIHHQISNNRLSVDYFKKRAFYQGVCDSYSHLRKSKIVQCDLDYSTKTSKCYNILSKCFNYFRILKRIFLNINNEKNVYPDIDLLKIEFKFHYKMGFDFHQNEFKNDPILQNWVLKDNYLDYKFNLY